jgi:hypothetical protein
MSNINTKTVRGDVYDVATQRKLSQEKMDANAKMFDLQAKDNTPRSARARFSIITHQTDQFRENYDKIDWSK